MTAQRTHHTADACNDGRGHFDNPTCNTCGSDDRGTAMTDDGITTTPDDGSIGVCRDLWHTPPPEKEDDDGK